MSAEPTPELPFEELDFVYMSCPDVAADMAWFRDALGARIVFAIEDSGTRVAMLELTSGPPRVLLTDHLEGERPILIYRVERLESVVTVLESRGYRPIRRLEIPFGPCAVFGAPSGQRLAVYERTRPGVEDHFAGRRDF